MIEKYPNRFLLNPKYASLISSTDVTGAPPTPALGYTDEFIYSGASISGNVTTNPFVSKYRIRENETFIPGELIWQTEIPMNAGSGVFYAVVVTYNGRLFYVSTKTNVSPWLIGEINPETGTIINQEVFTNSGAFTDVHAECDSLGRLWVDHANRLRRYDNLNDLTSYDEYILSGSSALRGNFAVTEEGYVCLVSGSNDGYYRVTDLDKNVIYSGQFPDFGGSVAANADGLEFYRSTAGGNNRMRKHDSSGLLWESLNASDRIITVTEDYIYKHRGGTTGFMQRLNKATGAFISEYQTVQNFSVGSRARTGLIPRYESGGNFLFSCHDRTSSFVVGDLDTMTRVFSTGVNGGSIAIMPLNRHRVRL